MVTAATGAPVGECVSSRSTNADRRAAAAKGRSEGIRDGPLPPPGRIVEEQLPRPVRWHVDERLAGDRTDRDGQVLPRSKRHHTVFSPIGGERPRRVHGQRQGPAREHDGLAVFPAQQPVAGPPMTRGECPSHLHGVVISLDPADQQGRGQQLPTELGHHPLGRRQPPSRGLPPRAKQRRSGEVLAVDEGGGLRGSEAQVPGGRATEQATTHRAGVEPREAPPVDVTVGGDQRRRPGVTEQGVVADSRGVPFTRPPGAARGGHRRGRVRWQPPGGSGSRS